jgi:4-amino-4-deoxy-L-arabinose transferase-like glycosyltransferase
MLTGKWLVEQWRQWVLIAVFCLPLFINLGANSLWDGNEGFYAEPAREVVETGNYLVPTYNYEPRFKKPPLATWIIALSYRCLGVSEFAERLPAALAAVLIAVLLYDWGRRYLQPQVGLSAALVLLTMLKFMVYTRQFVGDVLLTLLLTATFYCFGRAMLASPTHQRRYVLLAYLAMGLGVLNKGIVAIALPIFVLVAFIVLIRQWKLLWLLVDGWGYGLMLLVGGSWYLLMYQRFGWDFIVVNILRETVGRYTSDILGSRPWHYYLGVYLTETLPWSTFILPALIYWGQWLRREYRRLPHFDLRACLPLLSVLWFVLVFVFFSLSAGKRASYLLVLYPAAALTIGHYFTVILPEERPNSRLHQFLIDFWILITLFATGFLVLAYQKLEIRTFWIIPLVGSFLFSAGLLIKLRRDLPQQAMALAISGGLIVGSLTAIMPQIEYYRPIPYFAELVKQQTSSEALVGTFAVDTPSLMFYAERKIFQCATIPEMIQYLKQDRPVYFVTREDYFQQLQSQTIISLEIVARKPLLQLRWENFLGKPQPTLHLVLARKKPASWRVIDRAPLAQ